MRNLPGPVKQAIAAETRRQLFGRFGRGVGAAAVSSLLCADSLPHFTPRARRIIYIHLVGAPPQMDLFDYKPQMKNWFDKDLPDSIRQGQRLTTMTSEQSRFP